MNKFKTRLEEFLNSELSDYSDMKAIYDMDEYDEDDSCSRLPVIIVKEGERFVIDFKYDSEKDDLLIEFYENHFEAVREFDQTVKYFWMLVAPALFN